MRFQHTSLMGPYALEVLEVTDTTIKFNGYFRYDDELVTKERPVHRFFSPSRGVTHFIAITGIKRGLDTSQFSEDEEYGRICLTPTEIIEVDYHIVETITDKERYMDLCVQVHEEEEKYRELNYNIRRERFENSLK